MPYPGGVGGPQARPVPRQSSLRLASVFSKCSRNLGAKCEKNFWKKHDTFGDILGVPPIVAPKGGSALPRAKSRLTQCCARIRAPEGSNDSLEILK